MAHRESVTMYMDGFLSLALHITPRLLDSISGTGLSPLVTLLARRSLGAAFVYCFLLVFPGRSLAVFGSEHNYGSLARFV
jgi:hypothetical protein